MIIQFIVFTSLILFLFLWCKNLYDRILISKNILLKFIFCLGLTLIFKCDWGVHFLGMEYEDAYSFSAYVRQLSYGINSNDLRIEGLDIGSLNNPITTSTYGGHFITYPLFLYLFTSIFGFSFSIISIVNTIIAFMSLLTLALFYNYPNKNAWLIATISFCIAPAINLFSTTFLSESFSSLISICFILSFFSLRKNSSIYLKFFVLCSFFLAILSKRDNSILFIIPLLASIYLYCKERKFIKAIKVLVPFILIFIIISTFIHNILLAEIEETNDISQPTFSITIFLSQFPIYIKSLFSFPYFSISTPLFIIALVYGYHKKHNRFEIFSLLVLFLGYLTMYSAHYRGYYFIKEIETFTPFSTFRYINNFFYIIPIVLAIAIGNDKKILNPLCILISIFSCISIFYTFMFRKELSNEEYFSRFKNVSEVTSVLPENAVVITDVPLLFINVSSPDIFLCNLNQIESINFGTSNEFFLYCEDNDIFTERYNINLSSFKKLKIKEFSGGRTLYKLQLK